MSGVCQLNIHPMLEDGFCSGTGALTIFLKKSSNFDITTSDYNDEDIEKNICYNCLANDVPISPHILRKSFLVLVIICLRAFCAIRCCVCEFMGHHML